MSPPECSVEIVRGTPHTHQLLSGFLLLKRRRAIRLRVHIIRRQPQHWPFIVTVTVNGTVRVGYDLQDGVIDLHDAVRDYLSSLDHFFVRSYRAGHYSEFEDRVHPLGLNYDVAVRHPLSLAARFADRREVVRFLAKRILGYERLPFVDTFEEPPRPSADGPVILLTRAWDPDVYTNPEDQEAAATLNHDRADHVRALRREYGSRFVGGLQATPYAREHFPDCVVDPSVTRKAPYLRLVRRAAVCVTTEGLEHSNGWKLGEYVAASKPIVAPPLYYEVPGDFRAGRNYLPASDPAGTLAAVSALLADPELRAQMSTANHQYYRSWVRPDALVRHTLHTALGSAAGSLAVT